MISFLLIGFALRAYWLDGQSLWSDEGISLLRSWRSFGFMLDSMPVEQMPGYFVLLFGWLRLVGDNDYAVRLLSLWPSVLTLALTYQLAGALGSRRIGLFAVALLATNPFQIWYAQEARAYSWLLLVGLLSSWLFWQMLTAKQRHGVRYWLMLVGYSVATAAVVYLHYYGALVPIAHLLFALGWLLYSRDWRFFRHWVGGGLLSLLLFLPWIPRMLTIFDFPGWREPIDPWQIPWQILTYYTSGLALPEPWLPWLPWLYLALLGLGLIGWWQVGWRSLLFLLTVTFVPLLITFGIALQTLDYHERYTIVASAPLLLLAAGGLALFPLPTGSTSSTGRILRWMAQGAGILLLLVLVAGNRAALQEQQTNETFQKPDFRSAVALIERYGQPGDIVVLDGPDPNLVFLHYYRADYPIHDMRPHVAAGTEATLAALTEITADAQRVWEVVLFHEPRIVQQWLGRTKWAQPPTDHNGIRVTLYGLQDETMTTTEFGIPVGEALRLERVALSISPLQPGDLLQVTTNWQVTQPPPDYKFSLRLLAPSGEPLVTQDYVPQNWFYPTSQWSVGESVPDRRGFLLPLDAPSGDYQLTLRLYDPGSGAVAESPAGQDIVLGSVRVGE